MADRHAILNSRAVSTLKQKTDRVSKLNDGFGDFCFQPYPFQCTICELQLPFLIPRTRNLIDDEPESTPASLSAALRRRRGPFPFMKLPGEVRDKIYDVFAEPFRNQWQKNEIKIEVGVVHARPCHPFRNGYEMKITKAVEQDDWYSQVSDRTHRHLKAEHYEMIRSLSQVSHQVRAEMGAMFWSNLSIDVDHWEHMLLDFLDDRPAVRSQVKKLRMEWECRDSIHGLDDGFPQFCQYLTKYLDLDEINFVLVIEPNIAKQLAASTDDDILWVHAFREVRVKTLKVRLWGCEDDTDDIDDDWDDGEDDDTDSDASDGEGAAEAGAEDGTGNDAPDGNGAHASNTQAEPFPRPPTFSESVIPIIEALLRPQRSQTGLTDEEIYLRSRPQGRRLHGGGRP